MLFTRASRLLSTVRAGSPRQRRAGAPRAMAASSLHLYQLVPAPGGCPYAQRAGIALEEKGLKYETTLIDKAAKPREFLDTFASLVSDSRDKATVPLLIDGDAKVVESLIAVEYLDKAYRDRGPPLLPEDPLELARTRLFVELFTKKFQKAFSSLLSTARDDPEYAGLAETFATNLVALDKFLSDWGSTEGGDYFLGGRYSLAEVATTPFLRRGVVALRAYRDLDVQKLVEEKGLARLGQWIKAALARPSAVATGLEEKDLVERFAKNVK